MNEETRPQSPLQEAAVLPPQRQKAWLAMLLGAAILLCGIAIGVGATMLWLRARVERSGAEDVRVEEIVRRLQRRYGLSDEQSRKVAEVFRKRLDALQEIGAEFLPRIQAEHKLLHDDLRAILTPEQYERWHKDFEAMRRRRLGFRQVWMRGHRQGPPPFQPDLPPLQRERREAPGE